MQDAPSGSRRTTPRTIAGRTRPAAAPLYSQAMQQFQTAMQLMQEGKYDKARAAFEKLTTNAPPELLERVRVYLVVCQRNSTRTALTFDTSEEQYDYAISLLNTGHYEEAREQFEAIIKKDARADYAHYGLAILESMTGQAEECLDNLTRAIRLNPRNRIQARSDSDFQDMADDPRFTELIYPEFP
jgi:tetratricopeptide (TPR) repeat protein